MSSTCGSRSHRVACFLDRRASRQGSVRSEGMCARRALIACGLALPARRITVNLAPANLPKEGSHYDLPITLGLMAAIGAIPHDALTSFTVLGELGLDGSIAAVAGVLPAAISANGRGHGLICPYACGCEAAWASPEIEIVAAARIFLDFEQADDSATRKFSGTGLRTRDLQAHHSAHGGTDCRDQQGNCWVNFYGQCPAAGRTQLTAGKFHTAASWRCLGDDRRYGGNRGVIACSSTWTVGR